MQEVHIYLTQGGLVAIRSFSLSTKNKNQNYNNVDVIDSNKKGANLCVEGFV